MNEEPTQDGLNEPRPDELQPAPAPSGFLFPLKRLWWFFEKHFLWPIGDSFRRIRNAFSYRSPLAYIGATAMICITGGAIAAAVYFYDQASTTDPAPVVAEAPLGTETVVAPVVPVAPPATATAPPAQATGGDKTLAGVVPDFSPPSGSGSSSNSSSADQADSGSNPGSGSSAPALPATVVKPAPAPKAGALKVAHDFAKSFVGYEIGEAKATRAMRAVATPKLVRELKSDPPRLPSNGRIPKANVMNVVAGKKSKDRMEVSVALMRSGASGELRLELQKSDGKWLVSEVKG